MIFSHIFNMPKKIQNETLFLKKIIKIKENFYAAA